MKKSSTRIARIAAIRMFLGLPSTAQRSLPPARSRPLEHHDGYLPFVWDAGRGKVLFEISKLNEDMLYFAGTGKGIGSVELGVDRGASSASTVIYFDRVGPRVNVVQRNLKFRALQGNEALKQGMEESFASSILASLPIESEENGKITVDASPLLMRDAVNIEALLRRQNQGNYKLDPLRSSIYLPKTKGFPRNTEIKLLSLTRPITRAASSIQLLRTVGRLPFDSTTRFYSRRMTATSRERGILVSVLWA